ncbi:hypothetical protein AVEN_221069-1 [Araneus ventricosus]|uniref:Uncharacterized protein n=1 Tax=Araneus ventricosus TaxID=182803 RepID=A0A4Y2DXJ2_ARAVE|nr:hypothetical protein AVEN_258075-1 [Araneus ventricosus]GBM20355.1 hypothetical protein AVEN_112133-1 [Araneus ventricosus]GBM20358.1 hypothetical protein AVEN_188740-1 [Araneus ventricosus]GBM20364.1 hypothetical protein AVEN_221069-1 [Araneus ventricosus]
MQNKIFQGHELSTAILATESSKLSALVRICRVQRLQQVRNKSRVTAKKFGVKKFGNRTLFRRRQERLLPQFHSKAVSVVFLAAHPNSQSLQI